MANISVNSPVPVYDGQPLTFRSPADCSAIGGLIVHYHDGKVATSKTFQFADAHGNNVGDYDLFAADALVKVILDTDASLAFVQNADTNAYLERRLAEKAQTVCGSYVGTGKYGSANRNSITFPFVPKFLVVVKDERQLVDVSYSHRENVISWVEGVTQDRLSATPSYRYYSRTNNTVEWYAESADGQLNTSGKKYFYFAVGEEENHEND